MESSEVFQLPYIMPSQAQKHVTHNEAIRMLDALLQAAVESQTTTAPPSTPAAGASYIVPSGATGAWSGLAEKIAVFQDGAWEYFQPTEGAIRRVEDEDMLVTYRSGGWEPLYVSLVSHADTFGINSTADTTNRLTVQAPASLFNHEGSGHQLKINKAAGSDTASLLFQTSYSGRAEFGLAGDDHFRVKVSPDGSGWATALKVDKTTGSIETIAGSSGTPALTIGSGGIGAYAHSSGQLAFNKAIRTEVDGGVSGFASARYSNDSTGPTNSFVKTRGTMATPLSPNANDSLGSFVYYYATTTTPATPKAVASISAIVVAPTPSDTDGETEFRFLLAPSGSVTRTEIMRVRHSTGLSMFGANAVIDNNRHFRLRSYTIGTLPSAAAAAGQMIYCSDLGGGGGQLNSDGSAWRRVSRGGQQSVGTDAAFTLTPLTSAEEQRHTGTLTADRLVTLSTTNAYGGARFRLARTGTGAFNLSLGGLKNLASNNWAEAVYDGSAWYLASYGTL